MRNQTILDDLGKFISIPSYSTGDRQKEIEQVVVFLTEKLKKFGCTVYCLRQQNNPPLIVGRLTVDKHAKTIGIYGHYDVQPADPIEEWRTPPFSITRKGGKLYGRGIADNKGHVIQNMYAAKELLDAGKLTNNIVFLLEGEEESGSVVFEPLLKKHRALFSGADVWYITDVGMRAKAKPQIFYALRGLVYLELTVSIGERDLHSGVYGNSIFNPAQVIADLLSKMKNISTGKITIPGYYKNVRKIDKNELVLLKKIQTSNNDLMKEMKSYGVMSQKPIAAYLSAKILPSLDVNGMNSGYTGDGAKTIIPKSATVKFSSRLVEYQTAKEIHDLLTTFIKTHMPKGVKYDIKVHATDDPFYTSLDNAYVQKTAQIMGEHFGTKTLFNRSGGTIPAAEILQRLFHKPIILTGFTLPDDNIHAPNENFDEDMFWEGIEVLKKVYGGI